MGGGGIKFIHKGHLHGNYITHNHSNITPKPSPYVLVSPKYDRLSVLFVNAPYQLHSLKIGRQNLTAYLLEGLSQVCISPS